MSHRILVNTLNSAYRGIVQNQKGFEYGLGITTQLTNDVSEQLRPNEIYFSAEDLRDKQRKIKILFDSFTDPKFFGDGAVKIDKVQKYLSDIQLEAERVQANNNLTNAAQLAAAGYGVATAVGTGLAVASTTGAVLTSAGTLVATGGIGFGAAAAAFLPAAGIIAAANIIGNIIKSNAQAKREDDAAPWKMTDKDFPNITSQAKAGKSNRRSIERLYDDRSGKTFNVSTQEAIALLVRETLADALFCYNPAGGTAVTSPEHPGPGGNGTAEKWVNKDALRRHFPFEHVRDGADRLERTYVNALLYLNSYISLIDRILNLQDVTLSRAIDTEEATLQAQIRISLSTAQVRLFSALIDASRKIVEEKVVTFLDEDREYKTVLNFGNDRQYLAESWRLSPSDTRKNKIQFKLINPIESNIEIADTAFVGRELAKSVIDVIEFELGEQADVTPYLRPMNSDNIKYTNTNANISNATLNTLQLSTGSTGILSGSNITYGDTVFRRWLTSDFNSSELNIDFSDYKNFVHFGSAAKRLETFAQKLRKIEQLDIYTTGSVSSSIIGASIKAQEREDIIRNFDPYEQFLYYESAPYSASAYYVADEIEYNLTGSWPKDQNNIPHSPDSTIVSASWYPIQSGIAERYDEFNPNKLTKHLPTYLQEDTNSQEFITFVSMIGHLFDNIKVYIDQFPNIYSTNPDPTVELTMDQVYEVAQSFGVKLPNAYSLDALQSFVTNTASGSRTLVAETWKRFLHSMIFLNKIKGTKTSTDVLLSVYGINSPVLQVKETAYANAENYIKSEELTYGLQFSSSLNNNIRVPFVSSSVVASTIQLRFIPTKRQSSSIFVGEQNWAIDIIPHPSASSNTYTVTSSVNNAITVTPSNKYNYGKLQIVSGSSRTVIASSSYFPLFGSDYTNVMLRSQSSDLTIVQTDGDQILYQESMSVNLNSVWNTTTYGYIGGSGSLQINPFNGIIDEFRLWGENISVTNFINQAYDPGAFYGTNYTSSYNDLYVNLAFSQPYASITQSAYNESPYKNISLVNNLPAQGFTTASYIRLLRGIKQLVPSVGSTVYTNTKVKVVPPPVFNSSFIDENGTKILRRNTSIKRLEDKIYTEGQNIVSFAISPTDFINQNIIRSMGDLDVNNLIGSPRYSKLYNYSNLSNINSSFKTYFNKIILPNDYVRFFRNLIQSPTEIARNMVPARTKLVDGIVIESQILSRNKTYVLRSIKNDGTKTKELESYISGSGSLNIGAYPFETVQSIYTPPIMTSDLLPINGTLDIAVNVNVIPSTVSSLLPPQRKLIQALNNTSSLVTSSIMDEGSSYSYLEASSIYAGPLDVLSSPYPRNPFVGIPSSGSTPARFDSEDNTLTPLYDIVPRSDFNDVGTTTYFHKNNGIYSYDIYTLYKTPYLVKLDTSLSSTIDRLYAKITLLSTGSIGDLGRQNSVIPVTTYQSGNSYVGSIRMANIASLVGIEGSTGLRVRLYRDIGSLNSDATRDFNTTPTINSGVLFDGILDSVSDIFPYTPIQTSNSIVYYNIENTTISDLTSDIKIYYFAYEPATSQPEGYLPRHYKFSRENITSLKRRNHKGTQGTDSVPPPGCPWTPCPPFKVTPSGEYTFIVNQPTANTGLPPTDNITFGGGGSLDVG